jgi:hypothetical protein
LRNICNYKQKKENHKPSGQRVDEHMIIYPKFTLRPHSS